MGGWHGFSGWDCFRGFSEAGLGVRADDGAYPLSDARSSLATADLCLAELRSVSKIPRAAGFPRLLAGEARRPPVCGPRAAVRADQASRASRHRRRLPAALSKSWLWPVKARALGSFQIAPVPRQLRTGGRRPGFGLRVP